MQILIILMIMKQMTTTTYKNFCRHSMTFWVGFYCKKMSTSIIFEVGVEDHIWYLQDMLFLITNSAVISRGFYTTCQRNSWISERFKLKFHLCGIYVMDSSRLIYWKSKHIQKKSSKNLNWNCLLKLFIMNFSINRIGRQIIFTE